MTLTCLAVILLALSDQLIFYIHPRYIIFTTALAGVGLIFCLASLTRFRKATKTISTIRTINDHGADATTHTHTHTKRQSRLRRVFHRLGGWLIVVYALVTLFIIPPSLLTTATVSQRGINTSIAAPDTKLSDTVQLFDQRDYQNLTVKDWASLLTQTTDSSFFKDKNVSLIGFVSPDTTDPTNMFYVSRFLITCCAVDAQPIGVLVYQPNWQQRLSSNDWVMIKGQFIKNPLSDQSSGADQPIVLRPDVLTKVQAPKDPYVY